MSGGNFRTTFTVIPGSVTQVNVPDSFAAGTTALHVTTTVSVSLYASNFTNASYDVTGVLPTPALGTDYVLQSYQSGTPEFCILGVQNNTKVHYYHPVFDGTTHWELDSVWLDAGEKITVQLPLGDISGTHVWTGECEPIAVFMGCQCANVPVGAVACDHIYEQAIPTKYWGRRFVITSSRLRLNDQVKVTAQYDTTCVSYNGLHDTLQSGETLEFTIVGADNPAVYLESSKPVCTFLYLTGVSSGGANGDPSFCVIHPIEQQVQRITFSTFNTSRSGYHFVNISADTATVGYLTLDGQTIPDTTFHAVPGNPAYVYAKIPLLHGSHTLSSLAGGFNAQVYGLGDAESYSYAVGATLEMINGRAWLNNILSAQLDSTNNAFCMGDTLHFRAMAVNEIDTRVSWNFGDTYGAEGLQADHIYRVPGDYVVKARFLAWDGCFGVHSEEVDLPVHINYADEYVTDTMVCGESCLWRGEEYADTGSYSHFESVGADRCDALYTLKLRWMKLPPAADISMTYDCERYRVRLAAESEGDYYRWGSMPTDPELAGHEHDSVLDVSADTWRRYTLEAAYADNPACSTTVSYDKPNIQRVDAHAEGDPLVVSLDRSMVQLSDHSTDAIGRNWMVDGDVRSTLEHYEYDYPVSLDSVWVVLDAYDTNGCHDTDSLLLRINKEGLWVPNIFTPGQEPNSRFQLQGYNVLECEMWIYNRDGFLLWHGNGLDESWDGTCDGTPLPGGTYVYTLRYRCRFTPKIWQLRTGTVALLR